MGQVEGVGGGEPSENTDKPTPFEPAKKLCKESPLAPRSCQMRGKTPAMKAYDLGVSIPKWGDDQTVMTCGAVAGIRGTFSRGAFAGGLREESSDRPSTVTYSRKAS